MKNILWDMDGVLCDLHGVFHKDTGHVVTDGDFHPDEIFYPWFEKFVADGGMATLPEMPDFYDMESLCIELQSKGYTNRILSSSTNRPYADQVIEQKKWWLKPTAFDRVEQIFVKGAKMKGQWLLDSGLNPSDCILIDDFHGAGQPWANAGGIWVKHISYKDTYRQLKELGHV